MRYGMVSLSSQSNMWASDKWIPLFSIVMIRTDTTHTTAHWAQQTQLPMHVNFVTRCHCIAMYCAPRYVCVRHATSMRQQLLSWILNLQRSRIMSVCRGADARFACDTHTHNGFCIDGAVHVIKAARSLATFCTHTTKIANRRSRCIDLWHSCVSYDRFISSEIILDSVSLGHFSLVLCVREASSVFIISLNTNQNHFSKYQLIKQNVITSRISR